MHGRVPQDTWRARWEEISAFERRESDAGTTIVKCFLHISYEEQRERLLTRLRCPSKHRKFRERDIDERASWSDDVAAYDEAMARCSPESALDVAALEARLAPSN